MLYGQIDHRVTHLDCEVAEGCIAKILSEVGVKRHP